LSKHEHSKGKVIFMEEQFQVINVDGFLAVKKGSILVYVYHCIIHNEEVLKNPSLIPTRDLLSPIPDIVNILCPWFPLDAAGWDEVIDGNLSDVFSMRDRNNSRQLCYQGWQLYTFGNDTSPIDRSIAGIWERVPFNIGDILNNTTPPPYLAGP
jgi:hypothetical protein